MHDLRADRLGAVIFDKDGVLVDFERTWTPAIRAAALEFADGDRHRALNLLRKVGFDEASGKFMPDSIWAAGTNADLIDAWVEDASPARRKFLIERMAAHCEATIPVPAVPAEHMRRSMKELKKRGLKLALVSNDTTASAKGAAEHFGLADLFDFICGFDAVANPKPAADPVLAFHAACGVPAECMAVIGDNAHDAHMARAAGCALFIGVLSGNADKEHLAPLSDHVVPDVLEAIAQILAQADAMQRARFMP